MNVTEPEWREWVRDQIAHALIAARVTDQGRVREHRRTTGPGGTGELVTLHVVVTVPDAAMAEASLIVFVGHPDMDDRFPKTPPLIVSLRLWEDTLAPSLREMGWL